MLSKEAMNYIDSKNVRKESIPVYKDVITSNKNKQSNSNKIVKRTEDYTGVSNDYLYMITKNHNKDDVRKAIYYTIKRIEYNKWKDAEGYEVFNKEAYLEEAISNNINRNESTLEFKDRMSKFKTIFFK